jgi:rhodanese-related sulfurtransferase
MDDIPDLSVDEVARRLGTPDFHVFDNNSHGRWKRSHVPGAISLDPYDFGEDAMPANKQATLVFYCSGPG